MIIFPSFTVLLDVDGGAIFLYDLWNTTVVSISRTVFRHNIAG